MDSARWGSKPGQRARGAQGQKRSQVKRDKEVAEVRMTVREGLSQETCRKGGVQGALQLQIRFSGVLPVTPMPLPTQLVRQVSLLQFRAAPGPAAHPSPAASPNCRALHPASSGAGCPWEYVSVH